MMAHVLTNSREQQMRAWTLVGVQAHLRTLQEELRHLDAFLGGTPGPEASTGLMSTPQRARVQRRTIRTRAKARRWTALHRKQVSQRMTRYWRKWRAERAAHR